MPPEDMMQPQPMGGMPGQPQQDPMAQSNMQPIGSPTMLAGEKPLEEMQTAEEVHEEEEQAEESAQLSLSPDEKQKIVSYILKIVETAEDARAGFMDTRKECLDLLEGTRAPKSDPWDGCSNISVMAVPMHSKMMHSKIYPAVWNENLIFWMAQEKGDVEGTEKIRKFMDWVFRREMRMADTIDTFVGNIIDDGTIAAKVRWVIEYKMVRDKSSKTGYKEVAHQKSVVDIVPIEDVILPYHWVGEDASEFIAQNIYMRLPEIRDFNKRGIFVASDAEMDSLETNTKDQLVGELQKKMKDQEGIDEIYAHIESKPMHLIEICLPWEIDGQLIECVFTIAKDSKIFFSGKPLTAISPTGKRPWIIDSFLRRSGNSPYGIGLPELIKDLAKELDAIHNQRIDAGTVAIAPFGFYRAASSFRPDKIQIGPGSFIPVDDINDVKIAQFQGNFVASFQEERIIIEYIEKLTAISAYQMGRESDVVKSRATATGTMAIIGQGEQQFNLIANRVQRIIQRLLNKVLENYQAFMPTGLVDRVIGEEPGKLLFPGGLKPEEIDGHYDCAMNIDANVGSRHMERQTNSQLAQMMPQLLQLSMDPRGWEVCSDLLKSIGKYDIEKYIGPKPQPQMGGQGMMPGTGLPPGAGGQGTPGPIGPNQGGGGGGL